MYSRVPNRLSEGGGWEYSGGLEMVRYNDNRGAGTIRAGLMKLKYSFS